MNEKIFIGFSSTTHDSSISIIDEDGNLLFAEANERSLKNKRAWNAVPDSIGPLEKIMKECIGKKQVVASLSWSDSSLFWTPWVHKILKWRIKFISHLTDVNKQKGLLHETKMFQLSMYRAPNNLNETLLNLNFRLAETRNKPALKMAFDHHLCHAATACSTSRFGEALCLVADGLGESGSTALYRYENQKLSLLQKSGKLNIASLGLFYQDVCKACGFDPIMGEEWKVMGLAAYGSVSESYYSLLKPMLFVKNLTLYRSKDYYVRLSKLLSKSDEFINPLDASDLAYTAQLVFEELLQEFLQQIYSVYTHDNLILTGGCALNSSSNGKILSNTSFKNIHIPMAPGDDGNSIGAALLAWQNIYPNKKHKITGSPYLGSEISIAQVERFVKHSATKTQKCQSKSELTDIVSNELISGKIIGWIQGRAEFGPRALGNRSILADARSVEVKDKLNNLVKFREEFRPFAPSILHEHGAEYFYNYSSTPYMEKTLLFKKEIDTPGVIHKDKTGRLQSLTKDNNPLFYELINNYYKKTNVPIILNTSFNVMGRPIIHDMEDAFGVFMGSGMDMLVVGNYIFRK